MINLLPYEIKKQTKAARLNTVLAVYSIITLLAAAFLSTACYVTYSLLASETANNSMGTSETRESKVKSAKLILDQQSSFSAALNNLTTALPSDAVLNSFTTTDDNSGKVITIKFAAKSDKADSNFQTGLQRTQIFTNYRLISKKDMGANNKYRYEVTVSVNMNKGLNL